MTERPPLEEESVIDGPLALHLTLPNTPQNIATIASVQQSLLLDFWLHQWHQNSDDTFAHRPGAPINSQYVYDSKFRQNAYLAVRAHFSATVGSAAAGAQLAAAASGPLDEAYVGGGS